LLKVSAEVKMRLRVQVCKRLSVVQWLGRKLLFLFENIHLG